MGSFRNSMVDAVARAGVALRAALAGSASQAFSASTLSAATTIGVGAATPAASGAGITFPATQSASSDANTLDDYEEGTWTPRVFDAATGGNEATYTIQEGIYTKIGNVVYWRLVVSLASLGSMTAGNVLFIRGFPFQSAVIAGSFYNPSATTCNGVTFGNKCDFNQVTQTTVGYLMSSTSGGAGSARLVSDYTATAWITASGFYKVA